MSLISLSPTGQAQLYSKHFQTTFTDNVVDGSYGQSPTNNLNGGGAFSAISQGSRGALGLATASVQVLQSSFQSNMVLAPSNTAVTGLNTNGGGCMSIVLFFSFTDFVNYIGAIYVLCSSYLAGQVSFMSLNATTVLSMPP